jgi:hypothetical protein
MRHSNLLSIAIAGILGGGAAGSAYAVTPAQVPSGNRLYISGATATDNTLTALFLRTGTGAAPKFCAAGTIDMYIDGTNPTGATNRAILCTLDHALSDTNGTATLAAGTNVAILKESGGGSDRGTNFVANADLLAFRGLSDVSTCSAGTVQAAGSITSFVGHQAFTLHTGCIPTENVRTQAGIADVDPQLFTAGTQPITQAQIDRLTSDPLYQPMFGAAVSLNLYRALQRAQGIALAGTSVDDDAAHMPTLTRNQIAGLFADGMISDWSLITNSAGVPVTDASFTAGVAVPSTVYVCRRGDESGTQASAAQYFLNERCAAGQGVNGFKLASTPANQQNGAAFTAPGINNTNPANPIITSIGSTGDEVWAGVNGGAVRNCLDGHNDVNHFAIGLLGTDSVYNAFGSAGGLAKNADGNGQWRYVAIDGKKPNLESVANGTYDFVMENVLNMRNAPAAGQAVISGAPLVLHDYIKTAFASLDVIGSLVIKSMPHGYTGGLAGGLSGTPNAIPVTQGNLDTNPVSPFTKSPLGPVNNCGPAIPVAGTAVK